MAGRTCEAGVDGLTYHGGALDVAERLAPEAPKPWIDLSTGVNPHAYPLPDLAPEAWARLPDRAALAGLEAAAAERYGAPAGSVVAGPGSQALLHVLARLAPRGEACALAPTYGGYAEAFGAAGVGLTEAGSLDALAGSATAIVANPNNPDGRIVGRRDLLALQAELAGRGGLLIVDEAFADFDPGAGLAPILPASGTVALRSFGKTFGLAGLRLGFAVASPDVAAPLRAALGPWPVSGPAIAIGARALADFGLARGGGRSPRRRRGAARCAACFRRLARRRRDAALPPGGAARRQPRLQAPDGRRNPDPPLRRPPRLAAIRPPGRGGALGPAGGRARRLTRTTRPGDSRPPWEPRVGVIPPSEVHESCFRPKAAGQKGMPIRAPRVFTIPPGVPFLPTLSRALLDGALIEGFPGVDGSLALADATIYVPTQRAAAALAEALVAASGRASLILPRIAPLGAFEPDEPASFAENAADEAPRPGPPPAVGALTRRHMLATLVRRWGQALRGAIRGADANGLAFDPREPALVAATPAEAYALAGDLAALIDDMIIDKVDPKALDTLAPQSYDRYWGITLDFLKIAFAAWPDWLVEQGLIDRAARVAALVEAEVAGLASGARRGPTLIAGSTGANRATARLIAAVARADQGAVVLPGLDAHLDDRAWEMIGARDGDAQGLAGHPQALLHRLIGLIGVARDEVRPLGAPTRALSARAALVSEALRPAESTDAWRDRKDALAPAAVAEALADVTVIAADHETEEALALAIAMREVLETPGKTAALVTPDPSIARRVSAELARWGVAVEDSAGRALGETEAGALARLVLQAALEFRPLAVQALIAHPAARFGRGRAEKDAAARALEIGVFRAAPIPAARRSRRCVRGGAGRSRRWPRPSRRALDRRNEARRGRAPRARLRGGARPFARAQTLDAARRLARRPSRSARGRARGARAATAPRRTDSRRSRPCSKSGARRPATAFPARSASTFGSSTTRLRACAPRLRRAAIRGFRSSACSKRACSPSTAC